MFSERRPLQALLAEEMMMPSGEQSRGGDGDNMYALKKMDGHERVGDASDEPALREYVAILIGARWWIVACVVLAMVGGCAYVLASQPVYESDVVVQVEDRSKGLLSRLDDIPGAVAPQAPAEPEIEILRSRTLIGAIVDRLGLDLIVQPRTFPVVGGAIARWRSSQEEPSEFAFGGYAWGGERLSISRLQVPQRMLGEDLTLTVLGDGNFDLRSSGTVLLRGKVGAPAVSTPDRRGQVLEMFVDDLSAPSGVRFHVKRVRREDAVVELQRRLTVDEQGRKTGVLRIGLEGPDPRLTAATLDAIAEMYLRQNVERRSAEAEKTLEFINSQLPLLRSNLETAEANLERYRTRQGSAIDVSVKAKAVLDRVGEIEKRAAELSFQRAEILQRFTATHPAATALREKELNVERDRAALNAELKLLPQTELDSVRLMRDVKVANELYVLLLNKSQELKVLKSGTIGNVRIIDPAVRPTKPARPRVLKSLLGALLIGLGAGVAVAFARNALNFAVDDPEELERRLNVSVYASIPHSAAQASRRKRGSTSLLAAREPDDLAIEALRSLRTSLNFAMHQARNSVIAVTGPSPGIGKSFVTANLAHVLAEAGRRTLVIDADMRKGRLHQYFGQVRHPGLCEVIRDFAEVANVIRPTDLSNLHVLTSGSIPQNPAELLASRRFTDVIAELAGQFDVVLIDTPPVLAVTDAIVIGASASITLLVLRAGYHSAREVQLAARQMAQSGVPPHAIVLNAVRPRTGLHGVGYHYQYKYK